MLQTTIIGFIGADAETKVHNGKEFTTFRVSHSDKWKSEDGITHEQTTWVDCVMNGKPSVLPYLKKGTQVLCQGSTSLRVYSSPKDKCMKAGLSINVRICELVGASPTPSLQFSIVLTEGSKWTYANYTMRHHSSETSSRASLLPCFLQAQSNLSQIDKVGFILMKSRNHDRLNHSCRNWHKVPTQAR